MSRRAPQTIRIVIEQPGSTAGRPDISAEAVQGARLETGKRRAKL